MWQGRDVDRSTAFVWPVKAINVSAFLADFCWLLQQHLQQWAFPVLQLITAQDGGTDVGSKASSNLLSVSFFALQST
jgi:hypothetical protein